MKLLLDLYRWMFARPAFEGFNRRVMLLGLTGLGVLNYGSARASGEFRFLQRLLAGRRAPVCLDIGANQGLYTGLVLQFNPEARVHCFEPHPRTFQALGERLASRPGVTLNHAGCGDAEGVLAL